MSTIKQTLEYIASERQRSLQKAQDQISSALNRAHADLVGLRVRLPPKAYRHRNREGRITGVSIFTCVDAPAPYHVLHANIRVYQKDPRGQQTNLFTSDGEIALPLDEFEIIPDPLGFKTDQK